ncbi:transglycosylase domain-containing protein [Sphingomonas sanxanigenens]|uniref:transglycosylase domain-containing protein n=1 Tax=Sphingomonas sanxanigenens TaxID=397260 RepID=UPI000A061801|nr:transglycosylase domain-containing protein [Sphingomonas sanxanigenens]
MSPVSPLMFWSRDRRPEPVPAAPPPADPSAVPPLDSAGQPVPLPPSRLSRVIRRIKLGLLAFLLIFMLLVGYLAITAPLSRSLQPVAAPRITLLAADGTPIARRGAIIDAPVVIAELPAHVPHAFMAIEDRRFREHWGVDPWGIMRAAWNNLRAGGVREGGSTITQQLAKVAFLDADRTFGRKAREMLIAFWLEARLSKDEILARYLSNVYFGDNVYGLRAAAQHYFSVPPEDLSVGQAAMLAGLLKAPSRLAPSSNLEGARARQKLVVAAMLDAGFIDKAVADRAGPARLKLRRVKALPTGTWFSDWAMAQARDGAGAVYAEQEVKTTLDRKLQGYAERAVRNAGLRKADVALVAMRPDGQVVAMIGGRTYADGAFNRATQARRQSGSTFKLFVYLAALRAGLRPDDTVEDKPLTIGTWSPRNSGDRYRGEITLREAFAVSSNVAAVRLSEKVGRKNVIRAARDLGVRSTLADDATLALGSSGTTLIEMTAAYAAVAGNRYPVRPRGLPDVRESWFDSVWDRQRPFDEDEVLPALKDLLSSVVKRGTGRAAALSIPVYGKTGTSQDNRDAIFIGFAGDLVTGVWVGNDDNSPLSGVNGGGLPARVWRDFTASALGVQPRAAPRAIEEGEDEDEGALIGNIGNVGDIAVDVGNDSLSVDGRIGDVGVGLRIGPQGIELETRPPGNDPPPSAPERRDEALPPPAERRRE